MKVLAFIPLTGALLASALALSGLGPTAGSGTWTHKAALPVGVAEVGVAALNGKIYSIGGTEQVGNAPPQWASKLNLMYDPARDVWRRMAPLPRPLSHVGVAALGGKLYAIGGFNNIVHMGPQETAFVYDPGANRWSSLPSLSSFRGSVAVVAVGGKLHVLGGRTSTQVVVTPPSKGMPGLLSGFGTVNTHEIYDPATKAWSQASPVPGPARDHVGTAVLNGKIHLFGGRTADVADNLDRHDVYDPQTDQWTIAAPLPRPRSAGAYTVSHGLILYAGGECKPGGQPFTPNAYDDVTAYDVKTDRWTTLKALPQALHAFGATTVGNVAYFVGGAPVCGGGTSTDLLAMILP
jgi:N-acetylneuraminic acid mutarotase